MPEIDPNLFVYLKAAPNTFTRSFLSSYRMNCHFPALFPKTKRSLAGVTNYATLLYTHCVNRLSE
ncbi:MAG: hypothetical protein GXY29_01135 [Thermotogaceae bacterium]|nr:hypothetical protein [Thermotogaceae bacterium]